MEGIQHVATSDHIEQCHLDRVDVNQARQLAQICCVLLQFFQSYSSSTNFLWAVRERSPVPFICNSLQLKNIEVPTFLVI